MVTRLGEVVDLNPAKPPKDALPSNAEVTFVPMPAVDAQYGIISNPERRPFMSVRKGYTAFRDGDVILAKITPCMENGKAAIARDLINGLGFGSTEFHVLRPNESVIPEYLFYYVRQESFRRAAEAEMTGSVGQKRVPSEFLKNADFPLPPVVEQKRIVAKIEELLPRVNAVRERLIRVKEIMKRFRHSVLSAACSGRLTEVWRDNAQSIESGRELIRRVLGRRKKEHDAEWEQAGRKGWRAAPKPNYYEFREVKIDELPEIPEVWHWVYLPFLGYMNRGKSQHRPRNAPQLYGGIYPFIQTGDIARSAGKIASYRQTYNEEGLKQSRIWPEGTVCITIAANIAHSGILSYPACFPDSVVGVIPDSDLCRVEFLEYFIRTARSNLDEFAPATSQKNINVAILSDLAVPLPPLVEQTEIVHRVELLLKLADKIEKRVEVELSRTEKMTQTILAKAFRGELVRTEAELGC